MGRPITFLADFATFKKGDNTDILGDDIVSSLKHRGIVEDFKEKKAPTKKVVSKKKVLDK